jgi:HEAT repeat protein
MHSFAYWRAQLPPITPSEQPHETMFVLHTSLNLGFIAAAILWAGWSAYVLLVQRRRDRARTTISTAVATLARDDVKGLPLHQRIARIWPLLSAVPREFMMHAAAGGQMPAEASAALAAYVVERWGRETLERDAASHQTSRGKWRRMTALRVLFHLDSARRLAFLERALDEADADVASVALSLLGESTDPAAGELLIAALKDRRQPLPRVAVHLDRSPQHLATRLRPLLADPDPLVRRWAATLLGRYVDVPELERELAHVSGDPDPRVRKEALQSLGRIGGSLAATTALRLLDDHVPYVRAAAARAIANLGRDDLAQDVAVLLGDRDWFVRFAAKECLESMGSEIWPVLVRLLDDTDRFVRNGAAEVFQNLGLLDSFIVMEAATDAPAAVKIDLLRRIVAAGELRLTDSLFDRVGPVLAPRIRQLLANVGLQRVGAA